MKTFKIVLCTLLAFAFLSCQETQKTENKTKNPDTIVVKKDTAIKKSDTSGFNK